MEEDDAESIVKSALCQEESEVFDNHVLPNGNNGSDSMEDAVKIDELVSMNGISKSPNYSGSDLVVDGKTESLTSAISPEPALVDILNNDNCNGTPALKNGGNDEIETEEESKVENTEVEFTNGSLELPATQDDKSLIKNNADTKNDLLDFDFLGRDANGDIIASKEGNGQDESCQPVVANEDFGEFSAVPPVIRASAEEKATLEEKPQDSISSNVGDKISENFGDSGVAPVGAQLEKSEPAAAMIDDAFGNFGVPTVTEPAVNEPSESAADDEDFGDFSSDLPATDVSVGNEATEKKVPEDSTSNNVGDNISEDFGAFDAAPVISQPEETKAAAVISDDEFGDFGTVQVAVDNDDDDFGDFDTAPPESQPQTRETREAENDEFEDFGDFNASTESQPVADHKDNEEEDDFGNFSESPEPTRIVQQEIQRQDPIVTKAISVFADIFATDELNGEHGSTEDEESNNPVSLKAIMNEISCEEDFLRENEELSRSKSLAADLAAESLEKMILPGVIPIIQQASAKVIFGENTIHPYSQYTSLSSIGNPSNSSDTRETEKQQINMTISFESVESSNSADNMGDAVLSPEDPLPVDVNLDFSNLEAPKRRFWNRRKG